MYFDLSDRRLSDSYAAHCELFFVSCTQKHTKLATAEGLSPFQSAKMQTQNSSVTVSSQPFNFSHLIAMS